MKRFLFVIFCCFCGTYSVFAGDLSQEELKFRNSIEQFLKEEGYMPTIDDSDNSLNFKKEGTRYWLNVHGAGPYYIRLHISGYTMKDVNRILILEACNYANAKIRCGKAGVDDDSVTFSVSYYCHSIDAFRNTFYSNMDAAERIKNETSDYYNENDK